MTDPMKALLKDRIDQVVADCESVIAARREWNERHPDSQGFLLLDGLDTYVTRRNAAREVLRRLEAGEPLGQEGVDVLFGRDTRTDLPSNDAR